MSELRYSLVNKDGGFAIINKAQYHAWLKSPKQAIESDLSLKENLDKQTHSRGYNYSDYTPTVTKN
jgi:hypothetical protein